MDGIMTDEALALSIEQLKGERVTEAKIKDRIEKVEFLRAPSSPTLTICSIVVNNGYSVRGESACVDPANYNQQIGEKLAFEDAFRKLWPLFGFLLAEKRFLASQVTDPHVSTRQD